MNEFLIENGELTRAEYEYFFEWRSDLFEEAKIELERDYVNDLDEREIFLEGVVKRLNALGFLCDISEKEKIKAEIKRRYNEIVGEACPKTVIKWLSGKTVPSDINRENNYDLCLALEMDIREITEFFLKSYLLIPFNFKDKIDAVYYYSVLNNKNCREIKSLLNTAKNIATENNFAKNTLSCGKKLREIKTDGELFEYIKRDCREKRFCYTTARAKIKELALENMKLSTIVRKGNVESAKFAKDLYRAVMGFSAVDENFSLRKSKLPARFTYSFPNEQQLGNFLKSEGEARGGAESFELVRKTLILMKFYNFYKSAEKRRPAYELPEEEKNAVIKELIADFFAQTNVIMSECGFVQLYLRHPFDWLMLFCANTPEPLLMFRTLFAEELDKEI